MLSSGSMSALSRCSASRTGLCSRSAVAWAAMMASWAFWVKRSSCMSGLSGTGVGLVDEIEEREGGFASRIGEIGREDDPRLDVEVAVAVGAEPGHPLAREPEHPARLGLGRDREDDVALERADLDVRAQQCLAKRQRQLTLQVRAPPGEDRVRLPADHDVEIAPAGRLARQPDPGAGVGATGDRDLESLALDLDQP